MGRKGAASGDDGIASPTRQFGSVWVMWTGR